MEITEVKIFKAKQKGAVLAYANIVIDNNFIIRGITLLETERAGRFIKTSKNFAKKKNGKRIYI